MRKQLNYIKLLLTVLLVSMLSINANAQLIDKIVAQVGDEIIMLSDIEQRKLQMIQEGVEVSNSNDSDILEGVLYQKLLINQAQLDSLEVSDEMVNGEMEQRIRYFQDQIGGKEELEKFYGKSVAQIKAEFFTTIKKRMLSEMMEDKITETMTITPKNVKTFFKSLPKDSIPYINSKISVAHIVIYPEVTENDKLRAKKELEEYRAQIVSGEKSFNSLAMLRSNDPGSRIKEGDLGWQKRGTMVPPFEAALFELQPDEISPVFESQFGYHIIKMIERKGDNYHVRHILIKAKSDDKAFENAAIKLDGIYQDLNAGKIDFDEAAIKFSSDDKSKNNGGKIVNPYTNDYFWDVQNINEIDPQMYRIVDRLKDEEISSPSLYDNMYEQKSGVRIVKLLGKTKPHLANLTDDYQLISSACEQEKKQVVIKKWIEEKITGAYIRIDKDFQNSNFTYNWVKIEE
jgi:peptidyl-prolyl cis-trans isomerase SurA